MAARFGASCPSRWSRSRARGPRSRRGSRSPCGRAQLGRAPMTKPETPGAGFVPGDHCDCGGFELGGGHEVRGAVLATAGGPRDAGDDAGAAGAGRGRWPEIQIHQATIAAMRRSERMSVGGLVTAAGQRERRGVRAHVVSGEAWAARLSGSEARAERASGMRAAARHATKPVDATRQISGLRATCTSLTSASWIELGWKLAQGLGGPGLCVWNCRRCCRALPPAQQDPRRLGLSLSPTGKTGHGADSTSSADHSVWCWCAALLAGCGPHVGSQHV